MSDNGGEPDLDSNLLDSKLAGRDSAHSVTLMLAGLAGGLGVAIGAFGGHGLDDFLANTGWTPEVIARRAEQFEIGVRYHLIHAVVLFGLAIFQKTETHDSRPSRRIQLATFLTLAGILLFSGSLYVLVLTGKSWLGMITPLGGLSWIVAWLLIGTAGYKS